MSRRRQKLNLNRSVITRRHIDRTQRRQLQQLYERAAQNVAIRAATLRAGTTPSGQFRAIFLDQLASDLHRQVQDIGFRTENIITQNIRATAQAVVHDIRAWQRMAGLRMEMAFIRVPPSVIDTIATGQLYQGNWSLSNAIWRDIRHTQSDINKIIAQGVAENKPVIEIVKDLEKYVDPRAVNMLPGTKSKVEYNAMRLARTSVSHGYQHALERVCEKNPFVTGYIWRATGGERMCEICADRDGNFYEKGELPLDHPNGMCTFIAEIPQSMTDVADRIAAWHNGNQDPQIDEWVADMM